MTGPIQIMDRKLCSVGEPAEGSLKGFGYPVPKLQPYVLTKPVSLPVSAGRSFLKLIINVF